MSQRGCTIFAVKEGIFSVFLNAQALQNMSNIEPCTGMPDSEGLGGGKDYRWGLGRGGEEEELPTLNCLVCQNLALKLLKCVARFPSGSIFVYPGGTLRDTHRYAMHILAIQMPWSMLRVARAPHRPAAVFLMEARRRDEAAGCPKLCKIRPLAYVLPQHLRTLQLLYTSVLHTNKYGQKQNAR